MKYPSFTGWLLPLLSCLGATILATPANGQLTPSETSASIPSIKLVAQDAANLKIVKVTADAIELTPSIAGAAHNWFCATLDNLPVNRDFTIHIAMRGNDTRNKASVSKWRGLRPVFTYADPAQYESYDWFYQDKSGQWISGDPFKSAVKRQAGTDKTPRQSAIPQDLAGAFLSADGKTWAPWQEIESAQCDVANNVFSFTQRFSQPRATIAMRVPYTYTFLQQFIEQLKETRLPGVAIDEIGQTPQGRKLWIVRLQGQSAVATPKPLPTVLIIARERATEHATSWAAHGALLELIADTSQAKRLRQNANWLIVLMQDPDGAAESRFDRMTERFRDPHKLQDVPEVLHYARYFADYIDKRGQTLDVAVSLHNVEANEGPNIFSPFGNWKNQEVTQSFNHNLFEGVRKLGYKTGGDKPQGLGASPWRLYGWLSARFGALDLAYEVNDRFPAKRLGHMHLEGLGAVLAQELSQWCQGTRGQIWHKQVGEVLKEREINRKTYYETAGMASTNAPRGRYDLLMKGF